MPDFKFGRRPVLRPTELLHKPERVKKFVPVKRLSYAKLESTFRSFHPDTPSEDLGKLWSAFNFMKWKHHGQQRKSGTEPYHIHPFNVALYMAQAGGSLNEVVAAMLHDTLEDTDTSMNEINLNFGSEVANIVSLLSTPKIRQLAKDPALTHHGDSVLPLVYPGHSHYLDSAYDEYLRKSRKLTEQQIQGLDAEKKTLKNEHRDLLKEIQRKRIFPNTPLSDLNWSAIWIKQFDALHNLQTLGGMKKAEDREKFVLKSMDMALFLSDRLTPVITRSIPKNVQTIIEALKRRGEAVSHILPRKTDPKKWCVYLPPRDRLNYAKLMKIPPANDQVVNIHYVGEDPTSATGKVSDSIYEVLIPYSMIGEGENAFDSFYKELSFHLNPQADLRDRKINWEHPDLKLPAVSPGRSLLRPGVSGFHVFQVNLSCLGLNSKQAFLNYLKNAIKHSLVRFTVKKLLHLPKPFRGKIVNRTSSKLYWLPSNSNPDHVAVFLPYTHFGGRSRLSVLVPLLNNFGRHSPLITGINHEGTHIPPRSEHSFHTFVLTFRQGAKNQTKTRTLTELGKYLRISPQAQLDALKAVPPRPS